MERELNDNQRELIRIITGEIEAGLALGHAYDRLALSKNSYREINSGSIKINAVTHLSVSCEIIESGLVGRSYLIDTNAAVHKKGDHPINLSVIEDQFIQQGVIKEIPSVESIGCHKQVIEVNGVTIGEVKHANLDLPEEPKIRYEEDRLLMERNAILLRRRDLEMQGDFTPSGNRIHEIDLTISKIRKLPIKLYTGHCHCGSNRIVRDDVIKYCAWCHMEIVD